MYANVLIEISTCFARICKGELDGSGVDAFETLFKKHIVRGLETRNVTWEDSRHTVLKWTKAIAEDAEARRAGGPVTGEILDGIVATRLPAWAAACSRLQRTEPRAESRTEFYGAFCPAAGIGLR
jgi:hypothetical protein